MTPTHLSFPNESTEYREARNALLAEEMELRKHIESVAAQRRALPPGGQVPEDYVFECLDACGRPERIAMSKLFGPHPTLILYSFMYGLEADTPCTMCVHLLDSINAGARKIGERASLYIVAKSPLARLVEWGRQRGWDQLQFVSTAGNNYDADYFGDSSKVPDAIRKVRDPQGGPDWDETMFNVFRLHNGEMRHFWGSELTWAPLESGQDHRSGDFVNALYGLLDITPEGRGDFRPQLAPRNDPRPA